MLNKTITDLRDKNIISNTTYKYLEEQNKDLKQKLTQREEQYHKILTQLSTVKNQERKNEKQKITSKKTI